MGYKLLEVRAISANDLKNVSHRGKMKVYVVAYLSGPRQKVKTSVHQGGGSGTAPVWNNWKLSFEFDERKAINANWSVVFKLKHKRSFGLNEVIGEVRVPVKDLKLGEKEVTSFKVPRPSGKIQGEFKLSFKVSETAPPPVRVYRPPPPQGERRNSGFTKGVVVGVVAALLLL